MINKLLFTSLLTISLVSCDLMMESKNPLTSIENRELSLKIRNDTILQNILLGMHRIQVDSILSNSNSFYKLDTDYCYQFSNIPSLSDIRWYIGKKFVYHNDSLANFQLTAYNFEMIEKGISITDAFNTLSYNYKIKYGEPSFIKDEAEGQYYWINGNREIKIELNNFQSDVSSISISYEDISRRITTEMLPIQVDDDENTYTLSYWNKIKSKELKGKLKTDL